MRYPNEFYYIESNSKQNYSLEPTNNLSVERMLQGKPYFQKLVLSAERKLKKLIFTDWTARGWDRKKLDTVKESITKLINEGFSLYVWQAGEIVALDVHTIEMLDNKKTLEMIVPAYLEDIQEAVRNSQFSISGDQMFLLDNYWIERILTDNEKLVRSIQVSDFMELTAHEQETLININKKINPCLMKIVCDEFSYKANYSFTFLTESFPELTVVDQYKRIKLPGDKANRFIAGEEIVIGNLTLNMDMKILDQLETLDLQDSEINSENLQWLLQRTVNLKKLVLMDTENIVGSIHLNPSSLPVLADIDIFKSKINTESFRSLLIAASNARELRLCSCDLISNLLLEKDSLPCLEAIGIDEEGESNLHSLLQAAPHLKKLDFFGYYSIFPLKKKLSLNSFSMETKNILSLETLRFSENKNAILSSVLLSSSPNLKKLTLENCALGEGFSLSRNKLFFLEELDLESRNEKDLQPLLQAAPNLKTLKIQMRSTSSYYGEKPPGFQSLACLESIKLRADAVNVTLLNSLLEAAPHLKSLDLGSGGSRAKLYEAFTLSPNSLLSLEEMILDDCKISAGNLKILLHAAPNLKKVSLRSAEIEGGNLVIDPGVMKRLEDINLNFIKASDQSIHAILCAAPNTNKLSYIYTYAYLSCFRIAEEIISQITRFYNLEEISLHYRNISSIDDLKLILQASKNLKKLYFPGCDKLSEDLSLEQNSLIFLESIDLSQSNISVKNIKTLLEAAPNLKEIQLAKCENLSNDISLEQGFLEALTKVPHLENIDLKKSNINTIQLQVLLNSFPSLKHISLQDCTNLSETSKFDLIALPRLERLDLNGSNISSNSVQRILLASPNLLEVNFAACINLSNDKSIDYKVLSSLIRIRKLNKINLSLSNINSPDLVSLLYSLPFLKYINLMGCLNLSDEIRLERRSLVSLDTVYINDDLLSESSKRNIRNSGYRFSVCVYSRGILDWSSILGFSNPFSLDRTVDANTEEKSNNSPKVKHIFYDPLGNHPHVASYRLSVFNTLIVNQKICDPSCAFIIKNEGDMRLEETQIEYYNMDDLLAHAIVLSNKIAKGFSILYGRQTLQVSSSGWQAIASISPMERIIYYHLSRPSNVEIKYSLRDNLYYIKSNTGPVIIDIDFILEVPNDTPAKLPKKIINLVNKFHAFSSGKLKIDEKESTGKDYLQAIIDQQHGACRHRSIAFMGIIQQEKDTYADIQARIIDNDCHDFIEVFVTGKWVRCDLGGYAADLIYTNENDLFKPISKQESISKIAHYENKLQTWTKEKRFTGSLKKYCSYLTNKSIHSKILVELLSTTEVNAMQLALQKHCASKSRPVYYIDKPEDLICSSAYIFRNSDDTGNIMPGPGGPLYNFLMANQDNDPVLIVNYSNFKSDDIVIYNALLDKIPEADGTLLPSDTIVIGLIDITQPDCYQGADFYSRINNNEICPINSKELLNSIPSIPIIDKDEKEITELNHVVINLFNTHTWKEYLLGHWILDGNNLFYESGLLSQALQQTHIIEIQNGLWLDKDFQHFWQQLILQRNIHYNQESIQIPDDLQIIRSTGYNWEALRTYVTFHDKYTEGSFLLNPNLLNRFIGRYECIETSLIKIPGLLEAAKNSNCVTHLTRELSEDEWAILLTACQQHNVHVALSVAPGTSIPEYLNKDKMHLLAAPRCMDWSIEARTNTQVIASSDIDTTIELLSAEKDDARIIIDVSECSPANLLYRINGSFNEDDLTLYFSKEEKALLTALKENKHVILKGRFSSELVDALAELLMERQTQENVIGSLTIVCGTHQFPSFNYVKNYTHSVRIEDKLFCLRDLPDEALNAILPYIKNEPLSKLKARCNFICINPHLPSDNAWIGMYDLPGTISFGDKFDIRQSQTKAQEFIQTRMDAVNVVLARSPYVFITGLTGVGKSTFVEIEFCQNGDALYLGESNIEKWLMGTSQGRKILFLDEANLSHKLWSEFEGLFNNSPGILLNGTFYPLTKKHKVIFAGNPISYGDERNLAPFFARHGNAVLFEPLSFEFIYAKILTPIFEETVVDELQQVSVCQRIIDVYHFICNCSKTSILISPRELQMMAMMVVCYYTNHLEENVDKITDNFVYLIGKNLVPNEFNIKYDLKFKPVESLNESIEEKIGDFLITKSRQSSIRQLDTLLKLQDFRKCGTNDAQKYGGLGGIVFEGMPGIGKSELVVKLLISRGYTKMRRKNHLSPVKAFYRMQVSMSLEEKEKLLIKAFDEGAIVIIDEINSSPFMERLLNSLLMGKTPEGRRPEAPGFMVIGTQNPASMAGRREFSKALARRLITVTMTEYNQNEIMSILTDKGIEKELSSILAEAYIKTVNYAKLNHLSPIPTFRNLLSICNDIIYGRDKYNKDESPSETYNDDMRSNVVDIAPTNQVTMLYEKMMMKLENLPLSADGKRAIFVGKVENIYSYGVNYLYESLFSYLMAKFIYREEIAAEFEISLIDRDKKEKIKIIYTNINESTMDELFKLINEKANLYVNGEDDLLDLLADHDLNLLLKSIYQLFYVIGDDIDTSLQESLRNNQFIFEHNEECNLTITPESTARKEQASGFAFFKKKLTRHVENCHNRLRLFSSSKSAVNNQPFVSEEKTDRLEL